MTNASGINNFASGAVPASPPPSHAQPQSASSTNSILSKPIQPPQVQGISPRIVVDPSAGVIIQYLNGDGHVQTQIPSTTVVAYLKAGLTPDGLSKPPENGSSSSDSLV